MVVGLMHTYVCTWLARACPLAHLCEENPNRESPQVFSLYPSNKAHEQEVRTESRP